MLSVGGRLVYSTCSFNPVENEAVVAALLLTFGKNCLRLVDVSAALPGLCRRPGLNSWSVRYKGQWHDTWASVQARFPRKCPAMESHFPPAVSQGLERCLRFLPQDDDTGGFFVAVLEKA